MQQVTAVVNSGSSKPEDKAKVNSVESSESANDSASSNGVSDTAAAGTEEKANRREASLGLTDSYGAPLPSDTYLPTGPSNVNLPVPVYGVPNAPSNNIVYPAPPPDIPPPVALPLQTYGVPKPVLNIPIGNNYEPPPASNFITPPATGLLNSYGPPSLTYGLPHATPPKLFNPRGHKPSHAYGPPKPVYGAPSKPLFHPKKHFPKGNYRPKPFYGPPSTVSFPSKLKINNGNFLSGGFAHASFGHSSHSSHGSHGSHGGHGHSISAQYGAPLDTSLLNVGFGSLGFGSSGAGHGLSSQFGASGSGHGLSSQFGTSGSGHGLSSQFGASGSGHGLSSQFATSSHGFGSSNLAISSQFGSFGSGHSISTQYGVPDAGHGVSTQYGAPPDVSLQGPIHTSAHYGPPQPSPNPKPPHPGAPAPPTPPEIKYDGWQPIPGLVSRRPTDSYGVPPSDNHVAGDLSYNNDLSPPPLGHDVSGHGVSGHAISGAGASIAQDISITSGGHDSSAGHDIASLALSSSYNKGQAISDSYGAPLNTVTGSGGIVSSSGEEINGGSNAQEIHHQQHDTSGALALGLSGLNLGQDTQINTIKSIGYEIFPNGNSIGASGAGVASGVSGSGYSISDSYGAPPLNSYAPSGPYAAAHSYTNQGSSFGSSQSFHSSHVSHSHSHGSHNSHGSHSYHGSHGHGHGSHGHHGSHRGYKGLSLSSSGIGLIPPSGVYGAPNGQYGTPLYSAPKQPISFGSSAQGSLFQSIGSQGGLDISHSSGSTYLPPANIAKPPEPSTLYSLPAEHSSISFQNVAHGSSTSGLSSFNTGLHIEDAQAQALTSYNAPLGTVDGSYSATSGSQGGVVVGLDHSHPTLNIDLTGGLLQGNNYQSSSYAVQNLQTSIPHDCSLHSSQPLPSLSYGVPSANSYTAALSSLTTNIGGSYNQQANSVVVPHSTYGVPDLNAAHSQKTETRANTIETDDKEVNEYGKSVAERFGPNSELIKSQSIDLNNIPLQGNLGTYTLQIQSSDGTPGPQQVSHAQVLNEGLLQSILAAIEQPQQNGAAGGVAGQSVIQLPPQQFLPANQSLDVRHAGGFADAEPAAASSEPVVQTAENKEDAEVSESQNEEVKDDGLSILDDNDIALYYSNDDRYKKQTEGEGNAGENKSTEEKEVITNGH